MKGLKLLIPLVFAVLLPCAAKKREITTVETAPQLSEYLKQERKSLVADNVVEKLADFTSKIKALGIGYEVSKGQTIHDTFRFIASAVKLEDKVGDKEAFNKAMKEALEVLFDNTLTPPVGEDQTPSDNGISLHASILSAAIYAGKKVDDIAMLKRLYDKYGVVRETFKIKGEALYYDEITANMLNLILCHLRTDIDQNTDSDAYVKIVDSVTKVIEKRGINPRFCGNAYQIFKFIASIESNLRKLFNKKTPEGFSAEDKKTGAYKSFETFLKTVKNNKIKTPKLAGRVTYDGKSILESLTEQLDPKGLKFAHEITESAGAATAVLCTASFAFSLSTTILAAIPGGGVPALVPAVGAIASGVLTIPAVGLTITFATAAAILELIHQKEKPMAVVAQIFTDYKI